MPTRPNTNIERETTGEPFVEENIETNDGHWLAAPALGVPMAVSDDAPDSLAVDSDGGNEAGGNLSIRGATNAPTGRSGPMLQRA
jgi:hypothetical protein